MKSDLNFRLLPCDTLQGVGKRMAERLAHLGIQHVQDLLFHLPSRYQDRTRIIPLNAIARGDHVVIEGEIELVSSPKIGRTRLLCRIKDKTGALTLRFFYVTPFQRQQMQVGARLRCFGEIRQSSHGLEMIHPECVFFKDLPLLPVEDRLTSIYPTTEGLSQLTWRKLTEQALLLLTKGGLLQDILPSPLLDQWAFPSLVEALHFVHRPPANAPVELLLEGKHVSQKRLAFEELLAHRLSLLNLKKDFQTQKAPLFPLHSTLVEPFLKSLPFVLTKAQRQVIEDISKDLNRSSPMLRLVQGDVGSGKTVVAAIAALQAIENKHQVAFLAPTELLAEQHYQTFHHWFEPLGLHVVLLSGQMKVSHRRETLTAIQTGKANLILGTHAIFQKSVEFSKVGLIIVDEQHRFGVEQRAKLREKGMQGSLIPHQLIMTATPIPRTLAMSVYADLDYSVINELPPGRTPVTTVVISNVRRPEVLEKIRTACKAGRQVYWVCTLVEESETLQCQAAEKTAEELKIFFREFRIGLVHGRLKSKEKEETMSAFKKAELDILVATTVIEVGVDVPNASVMIIENAERLGLAQLHQLRGRVGRGFLESHCILMYQHLSPLAKERLAIMRQTTDGFKIAERDLELRGPGDVLGTRQTGDVFLKMADLLRDTDLLPHVQEAAQVIEEKYPEVIELLIQRWIGSRQKYRQV